MSEPRWDTLLSGDPAQVERGVDEWVAGVQARAGRMRAVQEQVQRIQVTETSQNGAVTVTVDANGVLTDVRFDEGASRLAPSELGPLLMGCLRRAQAKITERVREVTASVDDLPETQRMLVESYRLRFGEAPPEPVRRPRPPVDDDGGDESVFE